MGTEVRFLLYCNRLRLQKQVRNHLIVIVTTSIRILYQVRVGMGIRYFTCYCRFLVLGCFSIDESRGRCSLPLFYQNITPQKQGHHKLQNEFFGRETSSAVQSVRLIQGYPSNRFLNIIRGKAGRGKLVCYFV